MLFGVSHIAVGDDYGGWFLVHKGTVPVRGMKRSGVEVMRAGRAFIFSYVLFLVFLWLSLVLGFWIFLRLFCFKVMASLWLYYRGWDPSAHSNPPRYRCGNNLSCSAVSFYLFAALALPYGYFVLFLEFNMEVSNPLPACNPLLVGDACRVLRLS